MTNTGTISGKKRGRKPRDSSPPDPNKSQKTLQIKDDKEEAGSSNVQNGKSPVQRKPREKKLVDSAAAPPDPNKLQKTLQIKEEDGSSGVQKLDLKVCKGKCKAPVERKAKEPTPRTKGKKKVNEEEEDEEEVKDLEIPEEELSKEKDEEEDEDELVAETSNAAAGKIERKITRKDVKSVCRLTGVAVAKDEARKRWPQRYSKVMEGDVDCFQHYTSAQVDGVDFKLNDCCYIKAAEGESDYIGRIVEFFETAKKKPYICVKWFFRPVDTVIGKEAYSDLVDANFMNAKLIFASNSSDVNPLDCIVSKIAVVQSSPADVPECDFFYNMSYSEEFYTFEKLPIGDEQDVASTSTTISSKRSSNVVKGACDSQESVMTLLDLFSGCGGMSTGLCMGAAANNVNLVARWAVDYNEDACLSLRHNHPETEVRNEKAEDFLELLKKWKGLCESHFLIGTPFSKTKLPIEGKEDSAEQDPKMCPPDDNGEYEVEKLIDICYGDPNETGKAKALYYKVAWKGWGSDHDSWEPADDLVKCEESIKDFVTQGYQSNILPLPGSVDVVCGGPPCQGMSGFNRFRNVDNPLEDEKNSQLDVFMNIVGFLRPKYTLMENVVDILKFKEGYCGRYGIGRLVAMEYQVRLGFLVAGSFGLPQYRQRTFFWGAKTTEPLPQFPEPTHNVIGRGVTPTEFSQNLVAGDGNKLRKALVLGDAISDLPPISTHEIRDEMDYVEGPTTQFQRKIRLSKHELMGSAASQSVQSVSPKLYDHLPLKLSADDNHRVSMIPREKGANFRDLPGVIVDAVTKVASLDLDNRVFIESGKPLVPDYAIKFVKGKSKKPFGRLWFDEIVNTVVTRAELHNQNQLLQQQLDNLRRKEEILEEQHSYYCRCLAEQQAAIEHHRHQSFIVEPKIVSSREEESAAAAATTLDHFAMQLYHPVAADQVDQSCSSSRHNSHNSQLSPFHHHQFHPYRLQSTQPNSCKK